MNISLEDFYGALQKCARFWPETENLCLRLKGFRVLQHDGFDELTTDNMGATVCDDSKPYFYSADWEKAGKPANRVIGSLPVLTAFERQGRLGSPFDTQIKKTHQIVLTVWDKFDSKKEAKCNTCAGRVPNEIYRDTLTMLTWVMKYVGKLVLATTDTDSCEKIYNQDWLDQAKARDYITSYQIKTTMKNTLQPQGKEFNFYRQESSTNFLYGTSVVIDLRADSCETICFDFTEKNYRSLAHEVGCKNC